MQEVSISILAPKDNNDFPHCSFMRKVPPPPYPPYPLLWIVYQCTSPKNFPLELTKTEATRDAFWCKFFLLLCT